MESWRSLDNSPGQFARVPYQFGGGEAWRKALLVCGIASSLLYAVMIWAIRYEGYKSVSQFPSELTAIGAPTQRLWALLAPICTLLVAAFGWGIWRSAG
jgi:hypothetical protein